MLKPFFYLFFSCLILSCTSSEKPKPQASENQSIEAKIKAIRGEDNFGFQKDRNAAIYDLFQYPDIGYKNEIESLNFELYYKIDKTGVYEKGITWFVFVDNFKATEANWKSLEKWGDAFKYDMTALNEIFFITKKIALNSEFDRTDLIKHFIFNEEAQKEIVALREINEDKNQFKQFPFAE